MSLVCAQCSRVNPAEASYCFYDGAALAGRAGGPINAGSAPFANHFVFPNGLACRNFDQLANACQQHWSAAIDLLRQGFLGSFFGGMGRVDLAMAAGEAAKFPDLDRGLDQLLAKLPTQSLQNPKLQAEPSEVNLGQLKIGENRASEMHLTNLGMRLLYGTVTTDCKWLALGDAPGHPTKMFQFGAEAIIPVQVRGQHLRAGSKPIEGQLVIDSNGGTSTVTVRADVPITPFPGGPFDGAITPRQIAEKAKAQTKEAVPFFEHGDIAKWYAANGWAYPVQGPIMSGVGSIQQFFEALGVAKPPKVEFRPKTLDLQGAVGETVHASIDVTTADRKVVYGWATSEQPWIEVGKTKIGGKTATIPIAIKIPKPCPPTLETTINVVGNGNQKLAIPVKVAVAGGKSGVILERPEEYVTLEEVVEEAEETPVVLEVIEEAPAPPPALLPAAAFAFDEPAGAPPPVAPFVVAAAAPTWPAPHQLAQDPAVPAPPAGLPMPMRLAMHIAPLAVLGVCLFVLLVHDVFFASAAKLHVGAGEDETGTIDENPLLKLVFDEGKLGADYTDSMNFAVHKLDPSNANAASVKLNFYPNGFGNSIVAKIDGKDAAFGETGKWARGFEKGGKPAGKHPGGKTRTFEFSKEGVNVTQTVTIEPGDPIEVRPGEFKRFLSTCLVRYKVHNIDKRSHRFGLRILMDTCIGDNDGVPFTLPGVNELVTTSKDFRDASVPDFVQVLENPDLRNPGIVLQLNLRVGKELEAPNRFLLTKYPVNNVTPDKKILNKWDVDIRPFGDDSCVVIYWKEQDMKPNQVRELGFTYGVGNVSSSDSKLGVTVGGAAQVDSELTVVALVADQAAKNATLALKDGLTLIDPSTRTQAVPSSRPDGDGKIRPVPITWRMRATSAGGHNIVVRTDSGLSQRAASPSLCGRCSTETAETQTLSRRSPP